MSGSVKTYLHPFVYSQPDRPDPTSKAMRVDPVESIAQLELQGYLIMHIQFHTHDSSR